MFLRILAFFLGIVLAVIHVVVGLITYFIGYHVMGLLFLLGCAGYSAGAFLMIFNLQKGGLVLIALIHFLDFGMMLYYSEIMLLFACLMAEAAAFLIILDVWKGYATEGEEEPAPEVDMVTKKRPDPIGFDSNYYFNRYYDRLEGKEEAPKEDAEGGKPAPARPQRPRKAAPKRPIAKPKAKAKRSKEPAPKGT